MREIFAALQHEIWIHWMRYLFQCCTYEKDGSLTIPSEYVNKWSRQMRTKYSSLSESEKDSDREQADKIIDILVQSGVMKE